MFIRYYHVKLCLEKNLKPVSLHRLNYASFITGIASTVGITLVGSFQESNVSTMHFIGAFFAFGGMTAYLWMQTFLSQSLPNIMFSTKRVFLVRIFLLTWSVVLGTLCKHTNKKLALINSNFLIYTYKTFSCRLQKDRSW